MANVDVHVVYLAQVGEPDPFDVDDMEASQGLGLIRALFLEPALKAFLDANRMDQVENMETLLACIDRARSCLERRGK